MSEEEKHEEPATVEVKAAKVVEKRRDKIQVSNSKKPLFFYVNLCRRFLETEPVVEISGLGRAIQTCVTVAEILKSNKVVEIVKINTSLITSTTDKGTTVQKPNIQIFLKKNPDAPAVDEVLMHGEKKVDEVKKEE